MKVVLAEYAGACYGVQRALDMAYEEASGSARVCTLGQLIHNPGVVHELEEMGVRVAGDVEDIAKILRIAKNAQEGTLENSSERSRGNEPERALANASKRAQKADRKGAEDVVIIRSHGVTPDVREALDVLDVRVADATCPHVLRAQKGAAKLAQQGCHVIVVGEPGHPEVEGLRAYALREGAKVDVVSAPEYVPENLHAPVGVVVQTTQRRANLEAIVAAIEAQGVTPEIKDTICLATSQRQDAATQLAAQVDAMVIIGGRMSSNTTRLAEICQAACPRAFHIESSEEIDPAWFEGCETVGVTAGASTPENQIARVIEMLEAL